MDFKKVFNTMLRKGLIDRIQQIDVPLSVQQGVQKLYEQVWCQPRMRDGYTDFFVSNMGVKQGCSLSPTLFGIYFDKLKEVLMKHN